MEVIYNRKRDRININLDDMKKSLVDLENLINSHISEPITPVKVKVQKTSWIKKIMNF